MNTNLSGVDYFFLVVPVALVLFSWIALVLWADAHPGVRHVGRPRSPAATTERLGGRPSTLPGEGGTETTLAAGAADEHAAARPGGQQAEQRAGSSRQATVGPDTTQTSQPGDH